MSVQCNSDIDQCLLAWDNPEQKGVALMLQELPLGGMACSMCATTR